MSRIGRDGVVLGSARRRLPAGVGACLLALAAAGCSEQDMVTQPKLLPLRPSTFFADGRSSRPVVPGTVARGQLHVRPAFDQGELGGKLVGYVPIPGFDPDAKLDADAARAARKTALVRGRERFDIFCAPCHDRTGRGDGIVVQRGFSKPPSLLEKRLVDAPPGHYYKVITHGYGAMYSYASRIPPDDRWAIVAYIRALQLSQGAGLAGLPADTGRTVARQEGPAR